MNILLAVDGSAYSKKMLAYLTTHEAAAQCQQQLHIFHAQPALPPRARAAVGRISSPVLRRRK